MISSLLPIPNRQALLLFSTLSFLFFYSCTSDSSDDIIQITDFPEPTPLEGERLLENEMGLFSVHSFRDTLLITRQAPPYFKAYNSDLKLLADFGDQGGGPGEFENLPFLFDLNTLEDNPALAIDYHRGSRNLTGIDISKSIAQYETSVVFNHTLPAELASTINVYSTQDQSKLFGIYDDRLEQQLDERRGAFLLDSNSEDFELIKLHNLEITPYDIMAETNLNANFTAINQQRNQAVIVSRFYPLLEIIDLESGNIVQQFKTDKNPPDTKFNLDSFNSDELTSYYQYVNTTSEHIYLLYNGFEEHKMNEPQQRVIQILSWAGEPIARYTIPAEYDIQLFTVDESAQRIFAVSHTRDALFKFDLPDH